SRPVQQQFARGSFVAQTLAVFERACNLVTPTDDIIALVAPQIGDGPLNIVIDGAADFFIKIHPGSPVTGEENWLRVNGLQIDLGQAMVWEPQPDWDTLRACRSMIESHLPLLRALACRRAPANTLLQLLAKATPQHGLTGIILAAAQKAGKALPEGWTGNLKQLQEAGAKLAGLGGGLTPAGDDFLMGVMLWAWLAHPNPPLFCRTLLYPAFSRTTALSTAFLQAAARGECSVSWHRLLAALSAGHQAHLAAAVQEVLAHGATSGADTLAGFLYLPATPAKHDGLMRTTR
ncbi:MAG: DUF2877 domain-containing protein, partial [Anaerolineae bacterium]|nr:DUF2877 domain-containing protein [Anaerolineae bacterium]